MIASVTLIAALATVAPVLAEKPPLSPDQLVEVASACVAATNATGVDRAVLAKAGWTPAKATSNGKEIQGPLTFFGSKDSVALIILVSEGENAKFCSAISPLKSRSDFSTMRDAMIARFGTPTPLGDTHFVWKSGGDMIVLALTGKPDKPGITVGSKQAIEENK